MREWLLGKLDGKPEPEAKSWEISTTLYDLVTLRVPSDQDRLSELFLKCFGQYFPESSMFQFSGQPTHKKRPNKGSESQPSNKFPP